MARRMIALVAWLAALPAAAQDTDRYGASFLSYVIPYVDGFGIGDAHVPSWTPGTEVFAAVGGLALRAEPAAESERLRSLPAGARLRVVEGDAGVVREDGFVNRWITVETDAHERGHVFGAFLTTLALRADLDGDGRPDVATVAFTQDARALVRIASRGRPQQDVSFQVAGGGYFPHRGGVVRARLVPASEAGVALVQVYTGQDACSDYSTVFVSFVPTAADPVPRPRLALETSGLVDPPNFARTEERFEARSRTVEARLKVNHEDESGREVADPDRVERYRLRDGVYERMGEQ